MKKFLTIFALLLSTTSAMERQLDRQPREIQTFEDKFKQAIRTCDLDTLDIIICESNRERTLLDGDLCPVKYALMQKKPEVANFLIQNGFSLTIQDFYGNSSLHYSVVCGPLEVLIHILSIRDLPSTPPCQRVDLNAANELGRTALQLASVGAKISMLQALLACGANINKPDSWGNSPLHLAVQNQKIKNVCELIRFGALVNARTKSNITPMMLASASTDMNILRFIRENGGNIDDQDINGNTPLHYATQNEMAQNVQELALFGATVNACNFKGTTPLMVAALRGNVEILKILIESGAALDAADANGDTALHFANRSCQLNAVQFLLETGANATLANRQGEKPLHNFSQNITEYFCSVIKKEVRVNPPNPKGHSILVH